MVLLALDGTVPLDPFKELEESTHRPIVVSSRRATRSGREAMTAGRLVPTVDVAEDEKGVPHQGRASEVDKKDVK